ncbi:MAG: dipeptidase [Actinomycetes bacterium]
MSALRLEGHIERSRDDILGRLVEWLAIPSISCDPAHAAQVRASAEWCAAEMRRCGLEGVRLLETPMHPSVYGEWLHAGPEAPTVLVYGHHDVQPVDPIEAWTTPPFEASIRDGQLFARGSVDDKGQVLYHLEVVRALLARDDGLPVNLKFVIEGEEEFGSPNFEALLVEHAELLACDVVVVSDTGMLSVEEPSMCVGMRGLAGFDVHLRSASTDLHSGVFGGAVVNPAHLAASIVAALHDEHGRVTIPGFYDDVRELSDAERVAMDALPYDEAEFRRTAGGAPLAGEAGRSTFERTGSRPTAEIVGLHAGYAGDGIKTIVPATANLKVTFRMVPDQDPEAITSAFLDWLRARVPDGVECHVKEEGRVRAALTPVDHPAVQAAALAIERVWGRSPYFVREGGSGPEEPLGRILDAPVVFLGVGLPDDNIHAPDERIVLDQFWKGLLAVGELWFELARTPGVVKGVR